MKLTLHLEPCYLVHAFHYRETSLIVEVFTRHAGRLALIAKGARRNKSRWRCVLQPFRKLAINASGRGEMLTLTHAEELDLPQPRVSGACLYSGLYVNELVHHFLIHRDAHLALFDEYESLLNSWQSPVIAPARLRLFEKRLLSAVGYGLLLDHDASDGTLIDPEVDYEYRANFGPRRKTSQSAAPILQGRSLLALAKDNLQDTQSLQECKQLMRFLLEFHLDGKPLRSRELLYNEF